MIRGKIVTANGQNGGIIAGLAVAGKTPKDIGAGVVAFFAKLHPAPNVPARIRDIAAVLFDDANAPPITIVAKLGAMIAVGDGGQSILGIPFIRAQADGVVV